MYQTADPDDGDNPKLIAKKSLGQNFLTSDVVPNWLADAANIQPGDLVLEIGAGTGALTSSLLQRGAIVTAIETDARTLSGLEARFEAQIQAQQLKIVHADIRNYDLNMLGLKAGNYKAVANIPYYLSGFLLRLFLEQATPPERLVFLMQKEVVARIARSKKESLLSLSVKAFGQPHYIRTVSRGHFTPQPKIDSAILQVTDISHRRFKNRQEIEDFFRILHLGFGQKRKQLIANLAKDYDRALLAQFFTDLSLPLTVRAEDVPLEKWLLLTRSLARSA